MATLQSSARTPVDCIDCGAVEQNTTVIDSNNQLVPGGRETILGYECARIRLEQRAEWILKGHKPETFVPQPIGFRKPNFNQNAPAMQGADVDVAVEESTSVEEE